MTCSAFANLSLLVVVVLAVATRVVGDIVQTDLSAVTQSTSAVVGLASPSGDLVRSTDGGATFTTTRTATSITLANLHAAGDTVVAVGDGGFMVRSGDGGSTWSNLSTPAFSGELRDVGNNGTFWVAVGRSNFDAVVLWSANDGQSWSTGSVGSLSGTLSGVTYDASAGRWSAVGTDGFFEAIIATSTDGKNWSQVTSPSGAGPLTDVAADGAGNVLAVGEAGTLVTSSDGGATFGLDSNSGLVSENLNVVVYASATGWSAGGQDLTQISYTTGGGAVVTQAPVPGAGDITAMTVSSTGEVITAGELAGFQSITFASPGDQLLSTGSVTLVATASSSLTVSFELVSGPATLSGEEVSFTGTGTVVVRATQAGDSSFGPAPSVERSFVVSKQTATLSFSNVSVTYDGAPKPVTVTTDPTGLTTVVTYDGSTTAPSGAGSYAVLAVIDDASFGGMANDTLAIQKASQTIDFTGPADQDLPDASVALSGTASSGLPLSFTLDSGPASIDNNTVTMSNVGIVTLTATQSGNANFEAATPVTRSFTITSSSTTITLGDLSPVYDGSAKSASVTTSPAGLTVNVTYDGSATAPTEAGSYTVSAIIDDTTFSGSTSGTLVISKADQTIDFSSLETRQYSSTPIDLTATASSGLTVTFEVVSGPGSIQGGQLVLSGVGEVSVHALQPGNASYTPATAVSQTLVVTGNFDAWKLGRFTPTEIADPAVSGPDAVVTVDGITNLMKYALGLEPKSVEVLPTYVEALSDQFRFVYQRPVAVIGVTYAVEATSDLSTWSPEGVMHEMVSSDGTTEIWQATYLYSSGGNVFFRLKATL